MVLEFGDVHGAGRHDAGPVRDERDGLHGRRREEVRGDPKRSTHTVRIGAVDHPVHSSKYTPHRKATERAR